MLNICFLGKLRFEWKGEAIEDQLGAKAFALICLLVLNKNRYLSREKIIGYLWPDSNEEAARYNLRYNLWLIKKNIGTDERGNTFLHIDKECCGINKEFNFTCDILDIMKFKPSKKDSVESILRMKQLFRGDFLEGCYFNKCDEFNELIIYERINFEQRKVKILKRLVELYEKDKQYEVCLETINEILEIEPYDEEMVSKILDIYVRCGKRVAAITYYNQFSSQLAGNLGIAPSDALRDKYNEIRLNISETTSNEECSQCPQKCKKNGSSTDKQINQRLELKIITDGIKNIPFFWMSDVTEKIIILVEPQDILRLSKIDRLSLGCIQSRLLDMKEDSPDISFSFEKIRDVCIVNAFIKLLKLICEEHKLTILILNSKELDEVSADVVQYLKKMQIKGLKVIEE
ncbi:AfsR/SARP family transcriptional regulator [Sinanaerobacter sp. ZZT-01]|uniref:AfsR/SARP family transcriptional regulator n=1 Tax=Sinanaerobacter sp. ZZT-01 TaxID=3111540 RepID=UPI002D767578|nr:BTAD domain-containing putative transcriptional regulator [Sinanaerobacter sp. ZZT-01]WRR92231.1 BTAD domain-containing putative transcriptional regulator [Sinanaerobacter sp. ZZT-01]